MSHSTSPRYLTKSRFKLGLECPTKLFYTRKPEYANQRLDDPFLEALAQGGYQVGELAKHYYPGGHDIKTLDSEEALLQTEALLKQDKVIIYEAAIRYENLLIRIDILVKDSTRMKLIEVKAKSYDSESDNFMLANGNRLRANWAPYLHDVAFQHFVLANAFPGIEVDTYLMLANKRAQAGTDGLNTKFRIVRSPENRKEVVVDSSLCDEDLEPRLLTQVDVSAPLQHIYTQEMFGDRSFESHIGYLADIYSKDDRVQGDIGKTCKKCEFRCTGEQEHNGLQSGFRECWASSLGWSDTDFEDPLLIDLWNFRGVDGLIQQGKYKLRDLDQDDIGVMENDAPGLSNTQRQWLQVKKTSENDVSPYFDAEGMGEEMAHWKYPLHFIDFETTAVALPFTSGRTPYEGIAFQFSHHMVHEDGRVEHAGEFLDTTIGHLPSFDFIRELKSQLGKDNGTIFCYSQHENTYLNLIYRQLRTGELAPSDAAELCGFIQSISHSRNGSPEKWRGDRDMVDLWQLVKRYYYDPATGGSTSLKYILPAILNSSDYIKNKYSKPIYGAPDGMPSANFSDWTWVEYDASKVIDPYKLLPKLFSDAPDDLDERLTEDDSLANGGAALTAYAKMQFTEMSDFERGELRAGLLKYCELDTLAMVMIYQAWVDWVWHDSGRITSVA